MDVKDAMKKAKGYLELHDFESYQREVGRLVPEALFDRELVAITLFKEVERLQGELEIHYLLGKY